MTKRQFVVYCQSLGNLVAFHGKRFAFVAWLALVIASAISYQTAKDASDDAKIVAAETRRIALQNNLLIRGNEQRVDEIQKSRLFSCQRSYATMTAVLMASRAGRHLDAAEKERFETLLALTDPSKCKAQTTLAKVKPVKVNGEG